MIISSDTCVNNKPVMNTDIQYVHNPHYLKQENYLFYVFCDHAKPGITERS